MYPLLTERLGLRNMPNVLITNHVPKKVRNQIDYITWKCLSDCIDYRIAEDLCNEIKTRYYFHKGYEIDSRLYDHTIIDLMRDASHLDCLDFIDIICNTLLSSSTFDNACGDCYRDCFNDVLISNSMGYIIAGTQLVPNTDVKEAEEIIIPSYHTLAILGFDVVSGHLDEAYNHFKERNNSEAILSAQKALESTIALLLEAMSVQYEKKDKFPTKVDLVAKSLFAEGYMVETISKLNSIMKISAEIRNRNAGHGSSNTEAVPDSLVKYVIDLVTSNILFLARSYQDRKDRFTNQSVGKSSNDLVF